MAYTLQEVIDIAVEMEIAGNEYYTRAAEKFDNEKIRGLFSFLAEQEIKHRDLFRAMGEKAGDRTGVFDDDYFLYLKAIGGGRVFDRGKNIDEVLEKITTPVDALGKAFQDEKEAILFYTELKKGYGSDPGTVKTIDAIIDEERKHAVALWDLKERFKK